MAARDASHSPQSFKMVDRFPRTRPRARLVDRTPHREVAQLRVRCWLLRAEPAKYVHTYA